MNGRVAKSGRAPDNDPGTGGGNARAWSRLRGDSRRAVTAGIAVLLALVAVAIVPSAQPAQGGGRPAAPLLIGEHSALGPQLVTDRNRSIASMQQIKGEHAGISLADYQAESSLIRDHIAHGPEGHRAAGR
jgi:hypothetical protein